MKYTRKISIFMILSVFMLGISISQYIILERKKEEISSKEKRVKDMWLSFIFIFIFSFFLLLSLIMNYIFKNIKIIDVDGNILNKKVDGNVIRGRNISNNYSLNY